MKKLNRILDVVMNVGEKESSSFFARWIATEYPTRGFVGRAPICRKSNKGLAVAVLMLFNARNEWQKEIIFVPLRSQNKVLEKVIQKTVYQQNNTHLLWLKKHFC